MMKKLTATGYLTLQNHPLFQVISFIILGFLCVACLGVTTLSYHITRKTSSLFLSFLPPFFFTIVPSHISALRVLTPPHPFLQLFTLSPPLGSPVPILFSLVGFQAAVMCLQCEYLVSPLVSLVSSLIFLGRGSGNNRTQDHTCGDQRQALKVRKPLSLSITLLNLLLSTISVFTNSSICFMLFNCKYFSFSSDKVDSHVLC